VKRTDTAQVIQLSAFLTSGGKRIASRSRPVAASPQCEENVSTTCKNQRLRQQRHVNWRKANAIREYWRASLKMNDAISRVQRHNMPEGDLHPEFRPDDRLTMVAKYRAAIMQQLLTPASSVAEVTWKRAAFKAGIYRRSYAIMGISLGHGSQFLWPGLEPGRKLALPLGLHLRYT
jgi:hypothetical protein